MESLNLYPCNYSPINDLWVISCYYNPFSYESRRRNFDIFYENLKASKINHVIVECANDNQDFQLPQCPEILQMRNKGILWQKERLLNIAVSHLPEECKKVAWLDCDILFTNPFWAVETSRMLDKYKIVQPFSEAVWLPPGQHFFSGQGLRKESFVKVYQENPSFLMGLTFKSYHGHTGFAWAAQKNILKEHGLYDACIAGGADHFMAHAFCGDWDGSCIKNCFGENKDYYNHFVEWSKAIYPDIKTKISYVAGAVLHLWHGELKNRNYYLREVMLNKLNYNPYKDLDNKNKKNGLEFTNTPADIENYIKEYFIQRQEDSTLLSNN